ncbi:MAG TPA: SH3 domain-containing protein [Stellaceae bacterium]|jgi:Bacterial SH3 domain|nr:SH3 domain-containing protein [Stellaceae bacterium]
MLEAFVIAFIHCAGQRCAISYPRPDVVYGSYGDCEAQLPPVRAGARAGAEIACIAVPDRYLADEWLALEPTNLRRAPAAGADIIETIKRGATFRAYAEEHRWLCVETADGATGFVWSGRAKKIHTGPMTPEMKALHRCAAEKDEAAR